jgi:hypothetical protein
MRRYKSIEDPHTSDIKVGIGNISHSFPQSIKYKIAEHHAINRYNLDF